MVTPLAVLGIKRKFDAWQPAGHTGTFRGNQLAMGTGLATINTIKEQNLAQNAQERGDFLQAELKNWLLNSHVSVTCVAVV